jgi:Yos1-like
LCRSSSAERGDEKPSQALRSASTSVLRSAQKTGRSRGFVRGASLSLLPALFPQEKETKPPPSPQKRRSESEVKKRAKMVFSLGVLVEACLLFVNAVAVLDEKRFLAPSKHFPPLVPFLFRPCFLLSFFDPLPLFSLRVCSFLTPSWVFCAGLWLLFSVFVGGWAHRPDLDIQNSTTDKLISVVSAIRTVMRSPFI